MNQINIKIFNQQFNITVDKYKNYSQLFEVAKKVTNISQIFSFIKKYIIFMIIFIYFYCIGKSV